MSTPTINAMRKPASRSQLEFALRFMDGELERLLALAMAVCHQLEPVNPLNPSDEDNITAWRLAQLLEERLGSTEFSNSMRSIVLGEV